MKTINGKNFPQIGDIIEYNGKKYYTKKWQVWQPYCFDICALRQQCTKFSKEFNCESQHYFLTLKQAITEEKKKLKEAEQLIKKLESNL
jgi:hypothetical protein